MIAGDIIFRRSQGSMTQNEYQGIVKAYRIILEQLLAYEAAKDNGQSPNEAATETRSGETPSTSKPKVRLPSRRLSRMILSKVYVFVTFQIWYL